VLTETNPLGQVTTHAYDNAGNETSVTDALNRTTTYAYDGDGNRVQATEAGQTTRYLWDTNHGLPQLALERDGAGGLLRRYVYGPRRISLSTPSATAYYHQDNLGSVSNITSSTGATQWTYVYEPTGDAHGNAGRSGRAAEPVEVCG